MPKTYEPIATQTLGSSTTTVTFSSITGAYTDLVLVVNNLNTTYPNQDLQIRINSDTGTNYSRTVLSGNGTSATSGRNTSVSYAYGLLSTNLNWVTNIMQFMNYSNTTTYKTLLYRANSSGEQVTAGVDLWRNTAAINRLDLDNSTGQFATGSTFTLYGIKAA